MEKSRAIELLEHLAWDRDIERNPYGDALNMAIKALKAQLSKGGTTSDTISRQAAIDAINSWRGRFSEEYNEAIDDCENSIKELPPAQPEPQEGHWIPVHPIQSDDPGAYMCSKCKTGMWEIRPSSYHHCPNCGAKMRGERQK